MTFPLNFHLDPATLSSHLQPLTRLIDPEVLLNSSRNTIVYEQDAALQGYVMKMFSTGNSPSVHEVHDDDPEEVIVGEPLSRLSGGVE